MKQDIKESRFSKKEDSKQNGYGYRSYNSVVSYVPSRIGTFKIKLHGPIEDIEQLSDAIEAMDMAEEDDIVEISLQTCGGSVDAAGAFIHSMQKCKGKIHCIASGGVHSAGTLILLHADSFELTRNFNSLIHNGSSGYWGNMNEVHVHSKFDEKFYYDYFKEIFTGFLTESEFEDMIKGAQIWLDAEGWMERSEKRNEFYASEYQKLIDAVEKVPEQEVIKTPIKRTRKKAE